MDEKADGLRSLELLKLTEGFKSHVREIHYGRFRRGLNSKEFVTLTRVYGRTVRIWREYGTRPCKSTAKVRPDKSAAALR